MGSMDFVFCSGGCEKRIAREDNYAKLSKHLFDVNSIRKFCFCPGGSTILMHLSLATGLRYFGLHSSLDKIDRQPRIIFTHVQSSET